MNYYGHQGITRREFETDRRGSTRIAIVLGALAAGIAAAAVVTQLPVFAGIAVFLVAAAGGIFVLRHPSALLWALILTTPFNDYLGLSAGGLNVRPYGLLSALGAVWLGWQFLTRKKTPMREIAWHFKGTFLIVLLFLFSKLLTVFALSAMPLYMEKMWSVKFILFIAMQFAATFVCACFIDTPERLYQIVRAWIHLGNLICLVAFAQLLISNTTHYNFVWHKEIFPLGRPYSIFREPDVLGSFYAAFIVMLIPLLVANVKFVNRAYLWITLLAHSLFFIMIFVRAAWIATVVCLGLYVVLIGMTGRFKKFAPYLNGLLIAVLFAALGLVMAAPSVAEKLVERFASVSNPKGESGSAYRLMELEAQYKIVFHPQPWTGGGMATFLGHGDFSWSYWGPYIMGEDSYDQSAKKLPRGQVLVNDGFCMFLSVLFDNGVLGFLLYGMLFLALAFNFLKALRRSRDPALQALLLATFLPIVALLVCYQFSYDPLFLVLWIHVGIHLAAVYHVERISTAMGEIGIPEPA